MTSTSDPLQALIGYVQHKAACASNFVHYYAPDARPQSPACNCGLQALLSLLERRGPAEKDKKDEGDTRMDIPKVISDDFRTASAALPNVTVDNSGFRMNWDASSLVSKSTVPILTFSTSENAGECPVHGPIPMTQVVTISMGGGTDGLYCQRCFADLVAGHCHKFTR